MHHRDNMAEHGVSALAPRYFITEDNEDEWGDVADALGKIMMDMFAEYESYEVLEEVRGTMRGSRSLIGRIHTYEASDQLSPIPTEKAVKTYSRRAQKQWEHMRGKINMDAMGAEDKDAPDQLLLMAPPPIILSNTIIEGEPGEEDIGVTIANLMSFDGKGGDGDCAENDTELTSIDTGSIATASLATPAPSIATPQKFAK
jgi:hypothetical protein